MILESQYWEAPLLKRAKECRRRLDQKRWPEVSFANLERDAMLGFYEIRKLIEAKKLSDEVVARRHNVIAYRSRGERVTKMNWWYYWELYDLDSGKTRDVDLAFLCNQFVHSYVFIVAFDEHAKLQGVIVSSDHRRHHEAYLVSIDQVAGIFEAVGGDYPDEVTMQFNAKTGDYDVSSSSRATARRPAP